MRHIILAATRRTLPFFSSLFANANELSEGVGMAILSFRISSI